MGGGAARGRGCATQARGPGRRAERLDCDRRVAAMRRDQVPGESQGSDSQSSAAQNCVLHHINAPPACASTADTTVEQRSSCRDDGSAPGGAVLIGSARCRRRRERQRPCGPARRGGRTFPSAWQRYRRYRRRPRPQARSDRRVPKVRQGLCAGAESSS